MSDHPNRGLGPDPLIQALFPDTEWKVEWGLGRMERALGELRGPHLAYPCLHVGGTNGKGSVASVWASVLKEAGYRPGLYTSPHLCSFRERIVVDGRPIAEARLAEVAQRLEPIFRRGDLSFFEASTLLAFECFRTEGVDVGVIEVGLGGRLDATNVVEPLVTAITNVAMDHQEYLGDSLLDIAREKAGIIKAGVPVVTAERRPSVLEVFTSQADAVGAPLHILDPWEDISALQLSAEGTQFTVQTDTWGPLTLNSPLLGAHQATNAALAVRALEVAFPDLSPEAVVEGVSAVEWPGRVQIRAAGESLWVFDVAHNTAGVRALSAVLADLAPPRPLILLTGILGDKDWVQMLPPLLDFADHAIFTTPASAPSGRSWDPDSVATQVGAGKPIEVIADIEVAVQRAAALGVDGTVVVTGSCYTVGDALKLLGWAPYGG